MDSARLIPDEIRGGDTGAENCVVNLATLTFDNAPAVLRGLRGGSANLANAMQIAGRLSLDGADFSVAKTAVIGQGSFGTVFGLETAENPPVRLAMKMITPLYPVTKLSDATEALIAAKPLGKCGLIEFCAFISPSLDRIVVFMPLLQSLSGWSSEEIGASAPVFIEFLRTLGACLTYHGVFYPDLKCANIAFCPGAMPQFRLIDLDSVNQVALTFPFTKQRPALSDNFPIWGKIQTMYASAVTAFEYAHLDKKGEVDKDETVPFGVPPTKKRSGWGSDDDEAGPPDPLDRYRGWSVSKEEPGNVANLTARLDSLVSDASRLPPSVKEYIDEMKEKIIDEATSNLQLFESEDTPRWKKIKGGSESTFGSLYDHT
jgi:hypothetical protein